MFRLFFAVAVTCYIYWFIRVVRYLYIKLSLYNYKLLAFCITFYISVQDESCC